MDVFGGGGCELGTDVEDDLLGGWTEGSTGFGGILSWYCIIFATESPLSLVGFGSEREEDVEEGREEEREEEEEEWGEEEEREKEEEEEREGTIRWGA